MIPVRPIRASVVAAALLATGLPTAVVATAADGDAPAASVAAAGLASSSAELTETTRLPDRRSLVVGDRAYAMSTADSLYPAAGWHIRGEMGGVWTPPIKLVDGIWFRLADEWLGDPDGARATKTTVGWGYTRDVVRAGGPGLGGAHRLRARRHQGDAGRSHAYRAAAADRAGGPRCPLRAHVRVPVGLDHAERRGPSTCRTPAWYDRGRSCSGRPVRHPSRTRRRTTGPLVGDRTPPRSHELGPGPSRAAGPGRGLPRRRAGADDVRRRCLREGHRRAAALAGPADREPADHAVVRRGRLGQGRDLGAC